MCIFQKDCIKSACVHTQAPPPSRAAGRVTRRSPVTLARAHLSHGSSLYPYTKHFNIVFNVLERVFYSLNTITAPAQVNRDGVLKEEFTTGVHKREESEEQDQSFSPLRGKKCSYRALTLVSRLTPARRVIINTRTFLTREAERSRYNQRSWLRAFSLCRCVWTQC